MARLGQHFLVNTGVLRKIAAAVQAASGETIAEIGPGHGELTEKLVERFEVLGFSNEDPRLIAIEKDVHLADLLDKKFTGNPLVKVIQGDALKILPVITKTFHLKPSTWNIVGNIPYYITGHLLRLLGELEEPPARAVFLIQEEVAERAIAKPPHMNRLAASIRLWAEPKLAFRVPREDFRPQPKVDSAVILLEAKSDTPAHERAATDRLIGALFRQPRKTILNNLRAAYSMPVDELSAAIRTVGLLPSDRPQNASFDQIAALAPHIK